MRHRRLMDHVVAIAGPCLLVLGLACTSRPPTRTGLTAADERAVRTTDSAYVASWVRDDTTGVLATLASDAVLMPAGRSPLQTRDAIKAFWWPADGSHTKVWTFDRTIDEIGGSADIAWVRGTDSLVFNYDKGSVHSRQTLMSMSLAVLRRQANGTWLISRMMWGTLAK
jgi:ketosteroid isomerase-like protein